MVALLAVSFKLFLIFVAHHNVIAPPSQSASTPSSSSSTTQVADGQSNLPGGMASVKYKRLTREVEAVHNESVDAPNDGSTWMLTRRRGGVTESILLGYYVFVPPIRDAAAKRRFVDQALAADAKISHRPGRPFTEKIAGRRAYVFRFERFDGMRVVQVFLLGPVNSYRLECHLNGGDRAMARQCDAMIRGLKARP